MKPEETEYANEEAVENQEGQERRDINDVRCQCRIFAMTEKLFADHLESSVTFFAETLIASF
jgi:hypothetical protein